MQTFDHQRLAALDVAIRHDCLVLQQEAIIEGAEQQGGKLHRDSADADKQRLLQAVLADAAANAYDKDATAVLYNCALWAKQPFYREPPYKALFQQALLSPGERAYWLYSMLQLAQSKVLHERPWFAGLEQDPLEQRLPRIRREQASFPGYADSRAPLEKLKTAYLLLECRALLVALLSDALGQQRQHWQALDPQENETLMLENPLQQRYLRLSMTAEKQNRLDAVQTGDEETLIIHLSNDLGPHHLAHFSRCLSAYLQEQESAEAVQQLTDLNQENSNA